MRFQIPREAHRAGEAKPAIQCTADLTREAQGQSIFIRYQNALNRESVGQGEDNFFRVIQRSVDSILTATGDPAGCRQQVSFFAGEIRHLRHGPNTTTIEPTKNLMRTVLGPAKR